MSVEARLLFFLFCSLAVVSANYLPTDPDYFDLVVRDSTRFTLRRRSGKGQSEFQTYHSPLSVMRGDSKKSTSRLRPMWILAAAGLLFFVIHYFNFFEDSRRRIPSSVFKPFGVADDPQVSGHVCCIL